MISRKSSFRLLYGGLSPEEKPRYSIARAAHYLHVSPSTLRSWVRGRDYPVKGGVEHWRPLIKAADLLSFNNLIEAYVLRALRVDHKMKMPAVREALDYAQREFGISRLLLSAELQATPGNVFLERFGQLINLNRSGQLAARQPPQLVMIDPEVSFGRPILAGRGVRTATIISRIDAGEEPQDVAQDYGLEPEELEAAISYERAAA